MKMNRCRQPVRVLVPFGATSGSSGRYTLTAPISGVISNKDIVIGENVPFADQLIYH